MLWLLIALGLLVVFTLFYLRGENLDFLDGEPVPRPEGRPSQAHDEVLDTLGEFFRATRGKRGKDRLQAMRGFMDGLSDGREFASEFRPVSEQGVHGEWVLAPGADPARRLLYIHGGAWLAGSPRSHRSITDRLSALTGAAVFALDYRLMPENRRRDGIEDCRQAYRWILERGPDGPGAADFLVVAGDSAGGNLTLSLIAWVRDTGLRQADAAIALSPATDASMTSPSLRENLATDPMLGPTFGYLTRIPKALLWWSSWLMTRYRPADPDVSPLRGDLAGLPPVLLQVSQQEMLFDDARRYVTRAQLAGSPVELQSWPHLIHVWQIFTPELPEAEEAYQSIAAFLQQVASDRSPEARP